MKLNKKTLFALSSLAVSTTVVMAVACSTTSTPETTTTTSTQAEVESALKDKSFALTDNNDLTKLTVEEAQSDGQTWAKLVAASSELSKAVTDAKLSGVTWKSVTLAKNASVVTTADVSAKFTLGDETTELSVSFKLTGFSATSNKEKSNESELDKKVNAVSTEVTKNTYPLIGDNAFALTSDQLGEKLSEFSATVSDQSKLKKALDDLVGSKLSTDLKDLEVAKVSVKADPSSDSRAVIELTVKKSVSDFVLKAKVSNLVKPETTLTQLKTNIEAKTFDFIYFVGESTQVDSYPVPYTAQELSDVMTNGFAKLSNKDKLQGLQTSLGKPFTDAFTDLEISDVTFKVSDNKLNVLVNLKINDSVDLVVGIR